MHDQLTNPRRWRVMSGRVAVASSAILKISEPSDLRGLVVTFTNGNTYQYLGVPDAVHRAFLAAPSKGTFFNEEIRGPYRYRLISS
jgi:KTSC domain-containing protein